MSFKNINLYFSFYCCINKEFNNGLTKGIHISFLEDFHCEGYT